MRELFLHEVAKRGIAHDFLGILAHLEHFVGLVDRGFGFVSGRWFVAGREVQVTSQEIFHAFVEIQRECVVWFPVFIPVDSGNDAVGQHVVPDSL